MHISAYAARTFDGVAQHSCLRSDNYFYLSCLTGEPALAVGEELHAGERPCM